jgi:hypothetical protein
MVTFLTAMNSIALFSSTSHTHMHRRTRQPRMRPVSNRTSHTRQCLCSVAEDRVCLHDVPSRSCQLLTQDMVTYIRCTLAHVHARCTRCASSHVQPMAPAAMPHGPWLVPYTHRGLHTQGLHSTPDASSHPTWPLQACSRPPHMTAYHTPCNLLRSTRSLLQEQPHRHAPAASSPACAQGLLTTFVA